MLVFDVWAAVYLSGVLVARIAHVDALLWGGVSGACAGACFAVFRWQVPARVRSRDEEEDEPEGDEDGGWDLSGLIIYAVCVPFLMLFGFLVRAWFLVAIVLGFALAADAATLLGVVLAVACSIVASACAEYAVVHPLFRRWDIALD